MPRRCKPGTERRTTRPNKRAVQVHLHFHIHQAFIDVAIFGFHLRQQCVGWATDRLDRPFESVGSIIEPASSTIEDWNLQMLDVDVPSAHWWRSSVSQAWARWHGSLTLLRLQGRRQVTYLLKQRVKHFCECHAE